jgi:transposase
MAEECKLLLESLRDEELEKVVIWKLEGSTNDEIAEALGYSKRTIQRMVGNIREVWARIRAPLHD